MTGCLRLYLRAALERVELQKLSSGKSFVFDAQIAQLIEKKELTEVTSDS